MDRISMDKLKREAAACQDLEQFKAKAHSYGIDLSDNEANHYFAMLNADLECISDEELDSVSGGGCQDEKYVDGYLITRPDRLCVNFLDKEYNLPADELAEKLHDYNIAGSGCYECKFRGVYKEYKVCMFGK